MITPSYALTATERVLPNMMLDFTTASLDSRVTVTRALNTATAVNSSGNIAVVNANLPRFDYSSTSVGTCLGLLIEESRSNLVTSSGDLSNATYWITQRATAVGSSGTAPDGTNSATLVTEDSTAANDHLFGRQNFTASANATITISVYLKNNTRRYAILSLLGAITSEWVVAVVDLQAGVVTTTSNGASGTYLSSSIKLFRADGWYRCTLTGSVISANPQTRIQMSDTGTPASYGTYGRYLYNGDGTSSLYAWGAQAEVGAFATSYIPTTTTSLTRNADVVSMTGTNFSSWYSAGVGTLVARGFGQVTANAFTSLNDGTTANELIIGGVSSKGTAYALASSTTQIFSQPANVTANTPYSVAVAFASNNAITAVNATLGALDTTVTVPAYDRMQIGYYRGGNTYLNGCVSRISYYPQRLLAAETQAISK